MAGTDRKSDITAYVKKYTDIHGYAPSIREIGDAVGLRSTSSVHYYVTLLKQEGVLTTDGLNASPRTLVMSKNKRKPIPITLKELKQMGYVLCR